VIASPRPRSGSSVLSCRRRGGADAAGFLNDILVEAGGRRVLVKGRTYKETIPVESEDPDVEIEREVLRTSVVALDLRSGQFEVIEH
jgi:hypothetical protein